MSMDERKLRDAFDAVIAAEPDDRESLILQLTAADTALRSALIDLLNAAESEATESTIEQLASELRDSLGANLSDDPFDLVGSIIGYYRILSRLGQGAYGVVYEAEQTEPIARRVALKLLHPGVGSAQTVRRFHRERDVLAQTRHEGIAQYLDAGSTSDGRPYLVIELIDGPDLVTFADQKGLELSRRVELFHSVLDAVAHAHAVGVLHRDLKPSNVLIRDPDGTVSPVVIDFGVARWLDDDRTASLTNTGELVGTEEYMSPEQRLGGLADVRTDVFQLGHVLQRLTDSTHNGTGQSRELSWIISKSTSEEPERRYTTVDAFRDDIARWLTGEAIQAAPPSRLYALRKGLRKNRGISLLALGLVVLLVAYAGHATWLTAKMRTAERFATTRADEAEQLAGYLENLINGISPWVAQGRDVAVIEESVASMLSEMDERLVARPDVHARLLHRYGQVLGEYEQSELAESLLRRAVELRSSLDPPDRAALAESHWELARVLRSQGNRDVECLDAYSVAIDAASQDRGSLALLGRVQLDLGETHTYSGSNAEAVNILRVARDNLSAADERSQFIRATQFLAETLTRTGQDAKAATLLQSVLPEAIELHRADDLEGTRLVGFAGMFFAINGKPALSEQCFEDMDRWIESTSDSLHPAIAATLSEVSVWLRVSGDLRGARLAAEQSLRMSEAIYGWTNPHTLKRRSGLADVLAADGEISEAINMLREIIADLGDDPSHLPHIRAWTLKSIGELELNAGPANRGGKDATGESRRSRYP